MRNSLLTLLALTALGCGPDEGPAADEAGGPATPSEETPASGAAEEVRGETLEAGSSGGTFLARVTPLVDPIPMNEAFSVSLSLLDPETGAPFTDYDEVSIDARMPAHKHGMLRDVGLTPQEDGSMRADGLLLHMYGHWELHVDIRKGARFERAQISVRLQY
ncbi:MAG: hypothetical protein ISQ11_12065 [Planctomycetes bacterium]|nr:hypothetical protein [Planctomycetota bacterium]